MYMHRNKIISDFYWNLLLCKDDFAGKKFLEIISFSEGKMILIIVILNYFWEKVINRLFKWKEKEG